MEQQSGSNAYIILETLSRNKRYITYLGKNYFSGDKAVIKTIEPKCPDWDEQLEILYHEAETGQKLSHSCIIRHLNSFEEDRKLYSVMEHFESYSLDSKLSENPRAGRSFGLDGAMMLINQLLKALEYAHSLGIYHNSLNPSNILISSELQLKVLGFGKSRLSWLRVENESSLHPVLYLSPEQYQGDDLSAAANQYSFGVIAYQMLTGLLPWNCNPKDNHLRQKELSFNKPVLDPEMLGAPIPRWLFSILNRCLMIEPSLRFGSISELREALRLEQAQPFKSVLTPLPKPSIIIEPEPVAEPEPEPIPEPIIEPEPELIPEPVIEPEPIPEPVIEPEPEPIMESEPIPPAPQPAAAPQPLYHSSWEAQTSTSEPEPEDLKHTRKLFTVLIIISSLVVAYYALKYTVLRPKARFTVLDEEKALPEASANLNKNRPLNMISVPGDTINLGRIGEGGDTDEYPQLRLKVPYFLMSSTEITQAEWNMVYSSNPSQVKGANLPMHNITFYEAVEWCNEKSLLDGFRPCYDFWNDELTCDFNADGYRLPTEAEWEYAAAGKNGSFIYSGSNLADEAGWHSGNSGGEPKHVARKAANGFQAYDMSGNVAEWVWNWYAPYSYNITSVFEGPQLGTDKVLRGGSWFESASQMRVTNRSYAKPFSKFSYVGFRVVRRMAVSVSDQ